MIENEEPQDPTRLLDQSHSSARVIDIEASPQ